MNAITDETTAPATALDRMRQRAVSDYLAAEERAWDRLQAAIGRAKRVEESALV